MYVAEATLPWMSVVHHPILELYHFLDDCFNGEFHCFWLRFGLGLGLGGKRRQHRTFFPSFFLRLPLLSLLWGLLAGDVFSRENLVYHVSYFEWHEGLRLVSPCEAPINDIPGGWADAACRGLSQGAIYHLRLGLVALILIAKNLQHLYCNCGIEITQSDD